jgi:hypothetical protein
MHLTNKYKYYKYKKKYLNLLSKKIGGGVKINDVSPINCYLLKAHGALSKDTQFEVPKGFNFITFNKCGTPFTNTLAKKIWTYFSNPYNINQIEYIADYTTPDAVSNSNLSYRNCDW